MNDKLRPALAELVGTFAFFFIGAGAIITDRYTNGALGLIGIALAHGLALSVMVSIFGAISGAHFNPAVTIGLWSVNKIDKEQALMYIGAQLLGGTLAGLTLRGIFDSAIWLPVHLGTPSLSMGVTPLSGLIIEAILTFFLLLSVLGTAVDSMAPKIGGFGIGLTVAVDILIGGPITGAAMNPARVFGPGLAAGFWEYHWLYWVGPILGAVAAAKLYTRVLSKTV